MRYLNGTNRSQMKAVSLDGMIAADNHVRLIELISHKFYEQNIALLKTPKKGNKSTGRKAYNPISMMGLLIYGYLHGISSSRRLERATKINIEVRWLMKELTPDHWTICAFRRQNEEAIAHLIKQFRRFLVDKEYADAQKVVIDGSKVRAYARKKMLNEAGILKKLEDVDASIEKYLAQLEDLDTTYEEIHTAKKELEEKREQIAAKENKEKELKATINKLKKKRERLHKSKEQLSKKEEKFIAPNDPEAILVKGRQGKAAGYNVQAGVDEKGHFLLSLDVTTSAYDQNLLGEVIKYLKEQTEQKPTEVTADKGYGVIDEIIEIEQEEICCFVPLPKSKREREAEKGIEFQYDKESDTYTCTKGKTLRRTTKSEKGNKDGYIRYKCNDCKGCPLRENCTTSQTGRTIMRRYNEEKIQKYREKIDTPEAKEKIRNRKGIVEHPFGTIKMLMGHLDFKLVGKKKTQIELNLYAMAYNLKRLISIEGVCKLMDEIERSSWKAA